MHPLITPAIEDTDPKVLRRAIDLVVTLRARAIRVGFFGTLLYRPDPAGPTPPEELKRYLDILEAEVTLISTVCGCLGQGTALPDTPDYVTAWIHQIAQSLPDELRCILEIAPSSKGILAAAKAGTPSQGDALTRQRKIARGGFFEAVTELCNAIWRDLEMRQDRTLAKATQAAEALGNRLARLEHIGKHVRLVSLNASVEAAHAGDAGRGLMVIAREFKSLAEEIQQLAKDARADVANIS